MGSLWVARHVELDVLVAIKFSSLERTEVHDARFRREARATARLRSLHVVHVYDYGIDRDEPYASLPKHSAQRGAAFADDAFRRNVQESAPALSHVVEHRVPLSWCERAVQVRSFDTIGAEAVHLIFHQRDQR
jgi:serine/threonine protein kinase